MDRPTDALHQFAIHCAPKVSAGTSKQRSSRMRDKFSSFAAMSKKTREGQHWKKISVDRGSKILVAAPHAGKAEPHTGTIARAIAGKTHSSYHFETLVPRLHLTSHNFDEPTAIELTTRHAKVLTVHGCRNRSTKIDVHVGGSDRALRDAVISELTKAGFPSAVDTSKTSGIHWRNICNRGVSGSGVQLEICDRLRKQIGRLAGRKRLRAFANAVNLAIRSRHAEKE